MGNGDVRLSDSMFVRSAGLGNSYRFVCEYQEWRVELMRKSKVKFIHISKSGRAYFYSTPRKGFYIGCICHFKSFNGHDYSVSVLIK